MAKKNEWGLASKWPWLTLFLAVNTHLIARDATNQVYQWLSYAASMAMYYIVLATLCRKPIPDPPAKEGTA